MINWRIIVGIVLLFIGIKQLYTLLATAPVAHNSLYSEAGCGIWMAIGVYFIIRGITFRKTP